MTEPTKSPGHKTLAVKLPNALHAQLELISGLEDIAMGAALLRSVELYVETRRSQPDFAERAATAVAEAEAEAAARRSAIQALLGQASPVPKRAPSLRARSRARVAGAHGAGRLPRNTR